jgi:hypothetical protein
MFKGTKLNVKKEQVTYQLKSTPMQTTALQMTTEETNTNLFISMYELVYKPIITNMTAGNPEVILDNLNTNRCALH